MRTVLSARVFGVLLLVALSGPILAADAPKPAPRKDTASSKKSDQPLKKEAAAKVKYIIPDESLRHEQFLLLLQREWRRVEENYDRSASIPIIFANELKEYRKETNPEKAVIRYLERRIQGAEEDAKKKKGASEHVQEAIGVFRKSGRVPEWLIERCRVRQDHERREKEKEQKEKERSNSKLPRS